MISPVLLVTFNRLEYTKKTFESIRRARPPRLYLASDGPREHIEGEDKIVREIRDWLLNNVDWECEVYTRFLDKNSGGCAYGVSGAITWFFSKEKEGIVLEDDYVASSSFFGFCDELLDKYRDNKSIWSIAGISNGLTSKDGSTYHFSYIMNCWGWAGWADRWQYFDLSLLNYKKENMKKIIHNDLILEFYEEKLLQTKKYKDKSWAYPWTFKILEQGGLCINPYKNLVMNIGEIGVNNNGKTGLYVQTEELGEIVHPEKIAVHSDYEDCLYKTVKNEKNKDFYKHWHEKIFSVRSRGGRYKILTLLGMQIKLSENKTF